MKLRYLTWWACLFACLTFGACQGEVMGTDLLPDVPADDAMTEIRLGFSVGQDNGADTRMTATNVQAASSLNYLGIDYVNLVPFNINSDTPPVSATSQRLKRTNSLLIFNENTTSGWVRKHYYSTMLLPSGTKSFLVYARPAGGGENASVSDKYAYGSLIPFGLEGDALDDNAGSITFIPDLIADDSDNATAYTNSLNMAQLIAGYLTDIANASYMAGGQTVYWRNQTGNAQTVYSSLTHDGHVFTISSGSELKKQLEFIRDYKNYNDDNLTTAIKDKAAIPLNNSNLSKWNSFQGISNMPDGLIAFKWDDANHQFVALHHGNSKEYLNPPIADPSVMAYPAQLWYYANSKIRTSENSDLTEDDIKNIFINSKNWTQVLANENFTSVMGGNTVVNSQTKVAAIDNSLNYGVSRLMSSVKTSIGNIPIDPEKTATIQNRNIQWRGVLVTNQHKAGYDFQAVDDGTDYIVYDSKILKSDNNRIEISTKSLFKSGSDGNNNDGIHTLLVPTLTNEKVYMIAELYNNTTNTTITGNGGCVIPPQTYFYMVGELDPTAVSATAAKVFESDKYTKVDAVLNDFEGAYNYVPDLTSPALVLGLKIDLSWQQAEPRSVWLH